MPTIEIERPTIVAFFPEVTDAELSTDADLNEALADFQFYANQVRQPLEKRGIKLREVFGEGFFVRVGKSLTEFRPTKEHIGYYLVSPEKKPQVEYGVLTDVDLLQVAQTYFGTTQPGICSTTDRPDCPDAVKFFDQFQKAIGDNDRPAVASMLRYPVRVILNGKSTVITNRAKLIQEYDKVFDSGVLCAITHAKRADVWGNWQGFTVADGVIWWEQKDVNLPFRVITVNNESVLNAGCIASQPSKK